MASTSTSRSLFLLSLLLVSGLCVTASASRRCLQETNKLSLGDLGTQLDLDQLLLSKHGLIHLVVTVDLSELLHPVVILLEDAVGDLVELKVVEGLVTELTQPIKVKVTVAGKVNVVVKALGETVHVPLKLSELDPVLETVGDVVGDVLRVVLKLVEKVEKGLHVVQILDPVTEKLLKIITGAL